MGNETAALKWFEKLSREPFAADFYFTLRRIECLYSEKPRWGKALRPADEAIRLGQDPALAFASAPMSSLVLAKDDRPPRLQVNFFGLLGPNGPMPMHLTEFARDRLMHEGDPTFARFVDMLQHRWIAMFYRAWAQAQPTLHLDRRGDDRYSAYVGSLIGLGTPKLRDRDAVPDFAKLFYAGWLTRQVRNADGLVALLRGFFCLPVKVEQFVGHWMALPASERTRIGAEGSTAVLGRGAVLGERVWDRQHRIRVHLGPLSLREFERFLPGGESLPKLIAWMRTYLSFELAWDVRLVLSRTQIPRTRLGKFGQLGWTTWLGRYAKKSDADDLILDAETAIVAHGSGGQAESQRSG